MLKRSFVFVVVMLLCAICARGQGTERNASPVVGQNGQPIPGAQVYVCTYSAGDYTNGVYTGTVPCTATVAIYKDVGLSVSITQPLRTDGYGNYDYFAASGTYTECIVGPTISSGSCKAITLGGSGGGSGTVNSGSQYLIPLYPNSGTQTVVGPSNITTDSSKNNLTIPGNLSASGTASIGGATTIAGSTAIKGPSPSVDITLFGARSTSAITNSTAACTSGSGTITGVPTTLANGDGVTVYGCGPTVTLSAPSGPTVTTGAADGPEAPDMYVATGPTGSSTYSYLLISRDTAGGPSAAGTATTITNGPSALGKQTCSVTSGSLSGVMLTFTATGCTVPANGEIAYTGGTAFNNLKGIVVSNTSGSIVVAVNGAATNQGTATSTTGGTLTWWWGNSVALPSLPAGARKWVVCAERPGDASYHVIGMDVYARFTDFGWNEGGLPPNVTDSLCASAVAGTDPLSGTIASGGGTSSITLANSVTASQNATNQTIYKDDGVEMVAACTSAHNSLGASIYIPAGSAFYTYAPETLTCNVRQSGTLNINDTITSSGNWSSPISDGSSGDQFGMRSNVIVNCAGDPCVNFTGTVSPHGNVIQGIEFNGAANAELVDVSGGMMTFNFDSFLFSATGDYGGIGIRVLGGSYRYLFNSNNFLAGPGQYGGGYDNSTTAPVFYLDALTGNNIGVGQVSIYGMNFNGRGAAYLQNASISPDGGIYMACDLYNQGGIEPNLTMENFNGAIFANPTICGKWSEDTSSESPFAYLQPSGGSFTGPATIATQMVTNGSPTTGEPFAYNSTTINPGLNSSGLGVWRQAYANDFEDAGKLTLNTYAGSRAVTSLYNPVLTYSGAFVPLGVPVVTAGAPTSGGAVPVGAHTYYVLSVDQGGGYSKLSAGVSVTTTTGNQTVPLSWPCISGANGYKILRDNAFLNGGAGPSGGVTFSSGTCSYSDTSATAPGYANYLPNGTAAGSVGFSQASQALFAPKWYLSSSDNNQFSANVTGTFTGNRNWTLPDSSAGFIGYTGAWTSGGCMQGTATAGIAQTLASGCGSTGSLFTSYQFGTNPAITSAGAYFQLTYDSNFSPTYTGAGTSGSPYIATLKLASALTSTAANLTGCTPSAAGDICYWNGSAWTRLAGNASGTNYLQETSLGVPSWAASSGMVWPSTVGIPHWHTGTAWDTSINDQAALTGQSLVATNGSPSSFQSPGVPDGNGKTHVTTTPYAVQCDSATALVDRVTTIVFDSGASVINLPDHTATGCGSNMAFRLINESGGTLTVNRGGTDTLNITDGVAVTTGATGYSMGNAENDYVNNGEAGIWNVSRWDGNSSTVNSGVIPTSAPCTGTNSSKQFTSVNCVLDGSGSTTNNQLALATTTAHTIQYATTLPTAAMPALTGDVTNSSGSLSTTVGKVNGASIPAPASCVGTNSSSQFTSNTCVNVVLDTSTPVTVGGTNYATYHNNQNATAATAVTYNLPTAAAGIQKCFTNSYNGSAADTGVLTIATSATGQFIIFTDGTLSATGGNVTSGGAAGDAACVVGIDSTHWQLYVQRGTWTKH